MVIMTSKEVTTMKLLRQESERKRSKDDKPFTDFYLCWVYNDKSYAVRIRPHFYSDLDKLIALSELVPAGELVEKYI